MQALNLPKCDLKIRKTAQGFQVFDPLRKRYIHLTPEEWVRQHFIHYLIQYKGFPPACMANEVTISLNRTTKRCDTLCYTTQAKPIVIIEYKAPHISLSQHTLDQVWRYNMVLQVPHLILSNGIEHLYIKANRSSQECIVSREIPHWSEIIV